MARRKKTIAIPRRQAKTYLDKAEQFRTEAASALEAERYDAAMLNAVHAAISATDAITISLAGERSADPDHQRAVDLLEEVAGVEGASRVLVRQIRTLLSVKTQVEYGTRRARAREAEDAVQRAQRVVAAANEVVVD